jgi:ketosteroid isomerase-like protein
MDYAQEISVLKDRLLVLEEKERIRDALYGYVYAVDIKKMDDLMALFDEDVLFRYVQENIELKGKSQVKEFYAEVFNRYEVMMHKNVNISIQLNGMEATERSYWMVYEVLKEGGQRWGEGYYHHKFLKKGDAWKIKDLIINAQYFRVEKSDMLKVDFS